MSELDTTQEVEPGLAEFQAEAAKIMAEARGETPPPASPAPAAPATEPTGLGVSLDAVGIDFEQKPKVEAEAAPEANPEGTEDASEAAPVDDGDDPLLDAMAGIRPTRDERIAAADGIKSRALELGLPPGVASALAHNTPRKEAEEYLAKLGTPAQNSAAGQPVESAAAAPPSGAAAPPRFAEVQSALVESLGEEAASAVTGILQDLASRTERAEAVASATAMDTARTAARSQMMTVAGELRAECPKLVQSNGSLDPTVRQYAAALFQSGPEAGNVKEAMRAAYRLVHGATPAQRQTTTAATTPLDSPSAAPQGTARYIGDAEFAAGMGKIAQQFAGDETELQRRIDAYAEQVRVHNLTAKR